MNKRYLILIILLVIIEGLIWCLYPNVGDAQEYGDLFVVRIYANAIYIVVVLPVTLVLNLLIIVFNCILDDRIKIYKLGIIMQSICLLVNMMLIPPSIYAAYKLLTYGMQGFTQRKIDAVIRTGTVHSIMAAISIFIVIISIIIIIKYVKELRFIKAGKSERYSKKWREKYECK